MCSTYFDQCSDHDSGGWWRWGLAGWDGWEEPWSRDEKRTGGERDG